MGTSGGTESCSLWPSLSQWWAVLISAAELKANRILRSKCMLKLKMILYVHACVNSMEVLSGTDSHLILLSISVRI